MHGLAYSDRFLNDNIHVLFNGTIIEYDMKMAGLSLIQKYKLLDKKTIEYFLDMSKISLPDDPKAGKHKVDVSIGILQKTNEKLKEGLKTGFMEARDLFLTMNELEEIDIISIKKDAIFVRHEVEHEKIDEFINFRKKNTYTGYLLAKKIEIYYNKNTLDVKNLGEKGIEDHRDYFINFIVKFFRKAESSTKPELLRFLRSFVDKYKRLELDSDYYREFNPKSLIKYKDGTKTALDYRGKEEIDISYNFDILTDIVLNII